MHSKWIIKIVSWRIILLLATLAIIVQTISFTLSWYIHKNESFDKYEQSSLVTNLKISKDVPNLVKHINKWRVLDNSGNFSVVVGVLRGLNWHSNVSRRRGNKPNFKDVDISIVTHCSLRHVQLLPELAKRWQGPISVAVFLLREEIQKGLEALLILHNCFPEVKAHVTFSIVFPLNSAIINQQLTENIKYSCDSISSLLSHHNRTNYEFLSFPYPNNLLRNTARKIVYTTFITVLDIDLLPNIGLHASFIDYVVENGLTSNIFNNSVSGNEVVWVLPSYEIEERAPIPDDKASLLSLKEKGLARPFYQELCWKCQKYTNYDAWERDFSSRHKVNFANKLSPIYEVTWRDPWEPFYISRNNVPFYDERFHQYGFNRISQVCELHISGYQFLVLDSAFILHRGFKRQGSLHPSKDMEQEANRILFRQFKNDLKKKYPESSRRCY